ncbi:MAG: sugar ABC transporter permease [Mycobacterium sp.]|nr:sugar ABC transporter permease [Mycobacterium sp.]
MAATQAPVSLGTEAPLVQSGQVSRPKRFREYLPLYVAISPFYVIFAVFGIFPIAFSLYLAFHAWDGIGPMKYVGLEQFRYLLSDSDFWHSILVTFEIWVISTIPMLFLAMVIAVMLNSNVRLKSFYRIAYFIPNITSLVAIAIIFGSVFANSFGLTNAFLQAIGAGQISWLSDPWGIKVAIAVMVIWRWTGYNAIIYLAGLQAIPSDLFEAARIDGASGIQTFFRVTVPMMRPIILFTVITSTIGGMQIFTESQVLVGDTGGPGKAGLTMVLYLYQQAFTKSEFGYGAAIGWGLFVILILFSAINWRLVQGRSGR